MESNLQQEARLWEYIDGSGTPSERSVIEKLIEEHQAWKEKYHELLEIHHSLMNTSLEEPSMRFTKNIMDEIARFQINPAAKSYINKKVIWGLAFFFIALTTGFLIYGVSQVNWAAGNENKQAFSIDLHQIDYSKMFNNSFLNIFMMLNVILGLFLLDRFLANKRKQLAD